MTTAAFAKSRLMKMLTPRRVKATPTAIPVWDLITRLLNGNEPEHVYLACGVEVKACEWVGEWENAHGQIVQCWHVNGTYTLYSDEMVYLVQPEKKVSIFARVK